MSLHLHATKFAVNIGSNYKAVTDGKTLAAVNDCDENFVYWIERANVGDKFTDGGGAAPEFEAERIA